MPLDPDAGALGERARPVEHPHRRVDGDGRRPPEGEGDRRLPVAATEVEDPLAGHVAEQANVVLGRAVRPVLHDVGGRGA